MTGNELRKKFLDFFQSKGHTLVPSSSLIPDDSSVLLTTAGMQQFKKYYTGELDPMTAIHPTLGKPLGSYSAVSVQKSFRMSDIDEVGDATHLTFFEMLGNFSFGGPALSGVEGNFKKDAIQCAYEFITKELGIAISYVAIFGGSKDIPKDEESRRIWQGLGIQDMREDTIENVFWGPTGTEGPCGPTTEIYCRNAAGDDIEVWNIVFNEYYYPGSREELLGGLAAKSLEKLKTPGVDTGMGLERLAMAAQGKKSVFETDLFAPFRVFLMGNNIKRGRIIADHLRASIFLLADGIRPSNKEAGYILRRLLRRLLVQNKKLGFSQDFLGKKMDEVIEQYREFYNDLEDKKDKILNEFRMETKKFNNTLENGLKEFYKLYPELKAHIMKSGQSYQIHEIRRISGKDAFNVYQTFGFTPEIIKDLARDGEHIFDEAGFIGEFKKHQEISRAGAEKKFGGHGLLLDTGELKAANEEELKKVTRLHTATHVLHTALRRILGEGVRQMGSDITAERARFDFSFDRKLTDDEKKQIEDLVNDTITKGYNVIVQEMSYQEAINQGALHFFKEKYPERVKVYSIGSDLSIRSDTPFSRELCGGPHVKNTNEIGHFRILKEEAVASGVRRIRATVE